MQRHRQSRRLWAVARYLLCASLSIILVIGVWHSSAISACAGSESKARLLDYLIAVLCLEKAVAGRPFLFHAAMAAALRLVRKAARMVNASDLSAKYF